MSPAPSHDERTAVPEGSTALIPERGHANIVDYVAGEMATMSERPFSEVDSLVLAKLAYFHWEGVPGVPERFGGRHQPTVRDLYRAEDFGTIFETVLDRELDRDLFSALAASPRFRDVRVAHHVDSVDERDAKQFSATTFLLPDKTVYVAFRGTDNTIVGWKEDFNLAFASAVPAQRAAVGYLDRAAAHLKGTIRVGGHSKGGNLAVYAAARCEQATRDRIDRIFSHDGPGFNERTLGGAAYSAIADRVDKSVPESSMVGMLLEHQEAYHVIKSDAVGIMQHDPYSWQVREGDFVPAEGISGGADYVNSTLSDWISSMDTDQMERFTNALFDVFGAGGTKKFQDMTMTDYKASAEALVGMAPDERDMFVETIKSLASIGARNLLPDSLMRALGTAGVTAVGVEAPTGSTTA
ncbi:MAG: DUF2974 domain-containing protein [Atopobiaceae bacterium]|jgi:hypothetical protein|nr:DUF2974 domain-containing protein [Atopobiaceae bacterium]MCI2172801.1 DUF2974 domain-containing protein [Atopobiaceae bacterium]MCI2207108.1 DUF2974 domain-containing protein [Atopobiaceae bacterium]